MKTKSKRPSAPAQRSRGQQRARARLLHPRAGRRCTPRSRAPPMPRRRRRPFYSMGFARSAGALDIICAAREASGSGVWRRLTRGRAQACVAWRRRAGAGREYRGAPGSARCLRSLPRRERLVSFFTFRAPHRVSVICVTTITPCSRMTRTLTCHRTRACTTVRENPDRPPHQLLHHLMMSRQRLVHQRACLHRCPPHHFH